MNSITIFLVTICTYFLLSIIFKKVFYKGKFDKDNWLVLNLSIYAEIMLTILFLSVGVWVVVDLCINLPIWYEWIWPIIWIFYFLFKGLFIFTSRNNYLKIKGSELKYRKGSEQGVFKIDSYKLLTKESAAPSFTSIKDGWFLELKGLDNDKKKMLFDLKDLNLEGYKKVLENYFNKTELKKH